MGKKKQRNKEHVKLWAREKKRPAKQTAAGVFYDEIVTPELIEKMQGVLRTYQPPGTINLGGECLPPGPNWLRHDWLNKSEEQIERLKERGDALREIGWQSYSTPGVIDYSPKGDYGQESNEGRA